MENFGKTAVFPGGYGRKYHTGGFGRIGVYRVNGHFHLRSLLIYLSQYNSRDYS